MSTLHGHGRNRPASTSSDLEFLVVLRSGILMVEIVMGPVCGPCYSTGTTREVDASHTLLEFVNHLLDC